MQVWSPTTGKRLVTYRGHTNGVQAVAWSPDGTRIASASWDTTVQVWEATSGRQVFTYRGHNTIVGALAWSPNGERIASVADDVTGVAGKLAGGGATCSFMLSR